MARMKTDQSTILDRVVARLIDQVAALNAKTCVVTAQPPDEPPAQLRENLFCSVSPADGRFDQELLEGGGQNTLVEHSGVVVVLWSAMKLDRTGVNISLLTDAARGLFDLKRRVLKALTNHDLANGNGDQILQEPMRPILSEAPRATEQHQSGVGDLAITFLVDFEWDLS